MDKIVYTAIYGEYEELKDPAVVTPGWKYICYTDQPFKSKIWQVVQLGMTEETPLLQARMVKLCGWQLLSCRYSMWVDGSFKINCNLNDWWDAHFQSPMTCIQHPIRDCVYAEADACIRHKRGNNELIRLQAEHYLNAGIPKHNGVISSGILMRERTPEIEKLCQRWYEEVASQSSRDQLAFAYICWKYNFTPNTFKWDYRSAKEFLFTTHFNRRTARKGF